LPSWSWSCRGKYLWQGLTPAAGGHNGSNSLLMRFEYADERMPVADDLRWHPLLPRLRSGGSLIAVADGSGSMVKRITYDSFEMCWRTAIRDSRFLSASPAVCLIAIRPVKIRVSRLRSGSGKVDGQGPNGFAGGDTDLYGMF